ncbi:MAG: CDP-diacylglycerol--glycerol-3-phosphate 3-phosphatidyltransferase [Alphaproteobacteria bacterium]
MTLANILTLTRIIVIVPIIIFLWLDVNWASWVALFLYSFACITDFFDGWLARKLNHVTRLGQLMDPIADKLLVAALLIFLVALDRLEGVHLIAAAIILMREIAVSGLREHLAGMAVSVPVSAVAKWKTFSQMLALGFLIVGDLTQMPDFLNFMPSFFYITESLQMIGIILIWISALLTFYTGFHYFKAGLQTLLD